MNTIDLITLVAVGIGLFRGFTTGGIRQILSLAGIVVALVVAARTTEALGAKLSEWWQLSDAIAAIVAFMLVFFAIQLIAFGVARLVEAFLKAVKLGILDKVLGAGVGGFKAVLVLSLLFFGARYLGIPNREAREASLFYESVYAILPATWEFVAGRLPRIHELEDTDIPAPTLPDSL